MCLFVGNCLPKCHFSVTFKRNDQLINESLPRVTVSIYSSFAKWNNLGFSSQPTYIPKSTTSFLCIFKKYMLSSMCTN